jgi:hypothetical protein
VNSKLSQQPLSYATKASVSGEKEQCARLQKNGGDSRRFFFSNQPQKYPSAISRPLFDSAAKRRKACETNLSDFDDTNTSHEGKCDDHYNSNYQNHNCILLVFFHLFQKYLFIQIKIKIYE